MLDEGLQGELRQLEDRLDGLTAKLEFKDAAIGTLRSEAELEERPGEAEAGLGLS